LTIATTQPPISSKRFLGKDYEFICLLVDIKGGRYVGAEEVHRLPLWRSMAFTSVGKQIARLISELKDIGLDLIEFHRKTDGWRLIPAVLASIDPAIVVAANAYLARSNWALRLQFCDASTESVSVWARQNVKAMLAMTEGNAVEGYRELLQGYRAASSEKLLAISNVLATRIGQRLPTRQLPLPSEKVRFASMFELAAEARRLASYALRSNSQSWVSYTVELERLLPPILETADTTTQAIIFNALSILFKRQGKITDALGCIKEAAPLAVFSGDLILIQNVMFNFANILSEVWRHDPDSITQSAFLDLLELDIEIRSRFNIGRDSAQAELLTALLYYEGGNLADARRLLNQAIDIIKTSNQAEDRALYHRVNGLILIATSDGQAGAWHRGIQELDRCIELFTALGNEPECALALADKQRILAQTKALASA
jgi:tetratricopeptide (TPR) repeat protein